MLTDRRFNTRTEQQRRSHRHTPVAVLAVLIMAALLMSSCGPKDKKAEALGRLERDAAVMAIASRFAESEDLGAAQIALDELNLPNPAQSVLALAETHIVQGAESQVILSIVALAEALGPLSRMAQDYLASQSAGHAVAQAEVAPTEAPLPTGTGVPAATATDTPEPSATPTDTPEPTAIPTDTPVPAPQALADSQALNVRKGPGTLYPVAGQLGQGDSVDIIGRNNDSSWWQVAFPDGSQGWVFANLVTASGAVDGIELIENISPPPATSTPSAPPTATPAPKPAGPPFALTGFRLRSIGEHAQHCSGGDHNIFVNVVDAAGNPLNGTRVREIFTKEIKVTGDPIPGQVHWDIYRGGGGVVEIIDENGNPLSGQSRGMSADWPPFDLMEAAGYCSCKPHPDSESCRADLESKQYLFSVGHYVYEVTFQRQF
ncbi:MAG: SH3 domain-containing protein [Chloroflexota bacterium]|nr:SH3 domain-containing protein [Chloroflexota bacterium]